MEPKYLSAYVADEEGIALMDAVLWNGELWLVSEWLELPEKRLQTPAVAVRVDRLPHQRTNVGGADLVVQNPIPRAVLRGESASSAGTEYQVLTGPAPHFGWWAMSLRQ